MKLGVDTIFFFSWGGGGGGIDAITVSVSSVGKLPYFECCDHYQDYQDYNVPELLSLEPFLTCTWLVAVLSSKRFSMATMG